MNQVRLVFWAGFAIVGLGALISLNAGSLATNWQPLGDGGWGGTTDPRLAITYRALGIITFVFGLLLLAIAAFTWLNRKEPDSVDRPIKP